jgi:hypothetical protein
MQLYPRLYRFTHVGVDGGRELAWSGKLAVLAGVTGTIDSYHAVIGSMGERFIFYRLDHEESDETEQAGKALDLVGQELTMRQELATAMARFFAGLTILQHPMPMKGTDRSRLIALASLAARCRSAFERDSHSREIELILDAEAPGRLALTLARLFRGLEIIGVSPEDAWALLIKVALDCMPDLRRKVFMHLLEHHDEKLPTSDIATKLGYPTKTALRTLEDLAAHSVAIRDTAKQGEAYRWNLSDWAFGRYETAVKAASKADSAA